METTYAYFVKHGLYMKTKLRREAMYLYGSTIKYPIFIHKGIRKVLPRPYISSKPGSTGHATLNSDWFTSFIKDIEHQVMIFINEYFIDKDLALIILQQIAMSKKIIPKSLRICDTFFTNMTVAGAMKYNGGEIPLHFDKPDVISALFHMGDATKGGATKYYNGLTKDKPGKMYKIDTF